MTEQNLAIVNHYIFAYRARKTYEETDVSDDVKRMRVKRARALDVVGDNKIVAHVFFKELERRERMRIKSLRYGDKSRRKHTMIEDNSEVPAMARSEGRSSLNKPQLRQPSSGVRVDVTSDAVITAASYRAPSRAKTAVALLCEQYGVTDVDDVIDTIFATAPHLL